MPGRRIPRNVWAASVTSFLMDLSSEMVLNLLPLFLANVLGARTSVIGLIEGVAESAASLLKLGSGALSDRFRSRKWPAVLGYAVSALAKPGFLLAGSWGTVAGARWADRVGKGIRTAPRDALLADSIDDRNRGLAFGLHRAADTGGAVLGIAVSIAVVGVVQGGADRLTRDTFHTLVLLSLAPAVLAVAVLAFAAREARAPVPGGSLRVGVRGLGRPFARFLVVAGLFDLGNSSDAFLVLRAQERGAGVIDVLWMLLAFNVVYALVSTPAGRLSDRIGRRQVLAMGWLAYAAIYLGFARAGGATDIAWLYAAYGVYYGLATGTARAFVADLVPAERRAMAYGSHAALLGVLDLPASLIAGLLWQGLGSWAGFGPAAPFYFGAGLALVATAALFAWVPEPDSGGSS